MWVEFAVRDVIVCRGIERRNIFRDNQNRRDFVERLGRVLTQTTTTCLAWVLVPNPSHVLLRTGHTPIAGVMRKLLTEYVVTFNRKYSGIVKHESGGYSSTEQETKTGSGKRLGIVQSAVSKAVERGADLAADHHLNMEDDRDR